MSISKFINVNLLTAALITSSLLASPSEAILCNEYLRSAGAPTLTPELRELSAEEVNTLTKPRVLISDKPVIRTSGEHLVATFKSLPSNEPQILGLQTSRPYYRPNVNEVHGFMRYAPNNNATAPLTKPLIHSTSRNLIYGLPGTNRPLTIRLEYDEIIAAVTRLDEKRRVVVTIRKERAIGFNAGPGKGDHYLIEVYHFEETGYSVLGVRVPGTEKLPLIKMESQEESGILLTAGTQTFQLLMNKTTR